MNLGLAGKKALVCGASAGLGYAIAHELNQEGVHVCIASRNEERLRKAKDAMRAHSYIVTDSSRPGAGVKAVQDAQKLLGQVDILVINTGGPPKGSISELTTDQWNESYQSLWMNAVESIQAALPMMQEKRWGRILLVTSISAKEPITGLTISNGFRAGLLGLTKSIANEIAGKGVTINALLPGYTRTERLMELKIPEEKITAQIPAGRLGEPHEFGAMAAFLASEKAAYVTGQTIAVDGGALRGI